MTRNSTQPVSISRFDQFNEVKEPKEVCPAIGRFGIGPVRGAISRVDEAFGAFFRQLRRVTQRPLSNGGRPGSEVAADPYRPPPSTANGVAEPPGATSR
jgi:hypothetical protein